MFKNKLILVVAICAVLSLPQVFSSDEYHHPDAPFRTRSLNGRGINQDYEDPSSWAKNAQEALAKKLEQRDLVKQAKNAILFLGDGWGVSTMTTARILKGQEIDNLPFGEEGVLHTDTFPHTGTSKTYCVDSQVADSACSATAYLCGVKANIATIGVTSDVKLDDCVGQQNPQNHASSILKWAQDAGKSTGIVTTTRVTHASPSGTYAHIANRDWESDDDIQSAGKDPAICDDIAEQLMFSEPGKNFDVILGGGRRNFLPNDVRDGEGDLGKRRDGKNLINTWIEQNSGDANNPKNATYVETVEELLRVDASRTDRLLGLFGSSDVAFYHDQANANDPTLTDMTQKAIEILSKNPNGFVLFVEGGRIDHAHHDNQGLRALWESVEFDRAIQKGDEMTAAGEDTLIVITADHSHAFSFAGYPERGSPLTGFAGMGDDDIPYSTLGYANGPGFKNFVDNKRHNISNDNTEEIGYKQVPLVPLGIDTHGGEDVMIIAKGPFSHLFTGVQQQNYIPHAMAYATCIGPGQTYCN